MNIITILNNSKGISILIFSFLGGVVRYKLRFRSLYKIYSNLGTLHKVCKLWKNVFQIHISEVKEWRRLLLIPCTQYSVWIKNYFNSSIHCDTLFDSLKIELQKIKFLSIVNGNIKPIDAFVTSNTCVLSNCKKLRVDLTHGALYHFYGKHSHFQTLTLIGFSYSNLICKSQLDYFNKNIAKNNWKKYSAIHNHFIQELQQNKGMTLKDAKAKAQKKFPLSFGDPKKIRSFL